MKKNILNLLFLCSAVNQVYAFELWGSANNKPITEIQLIDGCTVTRTIQVDKQQQTVKLDITVTVPAPGKYGIDGIFPAENTLINITTGVAGRIYYETYEFTDKKKVVDTLLSTLKKGQDLVTAYAELVNTRGKDIFNPIRYVNMVTEIAEANPPCSFGIQVMYIGKLVKPVYEFISEFPFRILGIDDEPVLWHGKIDVPGLIKKVNQRILNNQIGYLEDHGFIVKPELDFNKRVVVQISNPGCFDDKILTELAETDTWLTPVFLFTDRFPEAKHIFQVDELPAFVVLYRDQNKEINNFNFNIACALARVSELNTKELIQKKIFMGTHRVR